jgi:hypothetical protein
VTLVAWAIMPRSWSTNRALRCVKLFCLTSMSMFIIIIIIITIVIMIRLIGEFAPVKRGFPAFLVRNYMLFIELHPLYRGT